jgi:hypothetical protein
MRGACVLLYVCTDKMFLSWSRPQLQGSQLRGKERRIRGRGVNVVEKAEQEERRKEGKGKSSVLKQCCGARAGRGRIIMVEAGAATRCSSSFGLSSFGSKLYVQHRWILKMSQTVTVFTLHSHIHDDLIHVNSKKQNCPTPVVNFYLF